MTQQTHADAALAALRQARAALDTAEAEILALQANAAPPATTLPPTPPEPAPAPPQPPQRALANPGVFFDHVRRGLGGLTQPQVDGINAILARCLDRGLPVAWTAYVLATPCLETGGTFNVRTAENLNYSAQALRAKYAPRRITVADANRLGRTLTHKADQQGIANAIYGGPWGVTHLGNTQPGDGWKYRGRSWPQATGRGNYTKLDTALGLGGRLVENPDLIFEPATAGAALVEAMVSGLYTGKSLRTYLPPVATEAQFVAARSIINPGDRAQDVARFASMFQGGLQAAGYPA